MNVVMFLWRLVDLGGMILGHVRGRRLARGARLASRFDAGG
jgi:hypothetical protein